MLCLLKGDEHSWALDLFAGDRSCERAQCIFTWMDDAAARRLGRPLNHCMRFMRSIRELIPLFKVFRDHRTAGRLHVYRLIRV